MEEKEHELAGLMADLNENTVLDRVQGMVKRGFSPDEILAKLQAGMGEVGERFEREQYFVPDLIFAGEILKEALDILKPLMAGDGKKNTHRIVMGTVLGDVHDLGKDIVTSLLSGSGYEVIDLGVNVPPDDFVASLKESGASLVGMSALLTMSFDAITNTVKAIADAGLKERVRIMIGGQPVTEKVRTATGADYFGRDALDGVHIAAGVYGA